MAQDIEKIISLLNEMQVVNASNTDSLNKLLSNIDSKLQTADKDASTELLKAYIGELSHSVEDKYHKSIDKFEEIEKALKAVYDLQDSQVKNSDMKELFEILSKNINNFYTEARQSKAILAGIESKISDISSNKTDKEDILRTISLLRNDIGNVNVSYKNTIDDINSTLKSILSGIKSVDPLKTGDLVKTQIDIMFKSINDILSNLHEIESKEYDLEKILNNVVTNEDFKVTMGIIDSIVEKTNELEEKLSNNAQKGDLSKLQLILDDMSNNASQNVKKEDLSTLREPIENLFSQIEEIKQSLGKVAQNMELIPNSENLEANLKKLYSHIYELTDKVDAINIKDNVSIVTDNLENLKEELELIRNIVTDYNESVTSKVLDSLESLSFNTEDIKNTITNLTENYPQKSDIEKILQDSLELNTILKRSENISQQLEQIPAIKTEINENISSLFEKTSSIEALLNDSEATNILNEKIDKLEDKLEEIQENYDGIKENNEKIDRLEEKLEVIKENNENIIENSNNIENNILSLSEFIKNNNGLDNEYITSHLNEIKALIEANSADIDNFGSAAQTYSNSVKEYLNNVKNLIQDSKEELYSKVIGIENSLSSNQNFNESAFSQIVEKINEINSFTNDNNKNDAIETAIEEISSLKSQISDLEKLFEQKQADEIDNPQDIYIKNIENFLSEKLSDINNDLEKITTTTTEKISEGFAYQAQLLEQKTIAIQELLSEKELTENLDNSEFNSKIAGANEILEGFKQELQLISTDITENITDKANKYLKELEPIKELLLKISENSNPEIIKEKVADLNKELTNTPELIDMSLDFEDLYRKLSEKFDDQENNLKDFVLTETDSMIIKFDNLRDYIEQAVSAMIPPDTDNVKELLSFVSDIKYFKEEQQKLINKNAAEIKNEIKTQSDEIKSMLAVAANHQDIIDAIESLKKSFKTKTSKTSKSSENNDAEEQTVTFNEDAIEELKADFEKYSRKIEKLSDDNTQISAVLQNISEHLNLFNKNVNNAEGTELSDDFEVTEDDIFGEDKFDFVQAFDILQNDIRNLRSTILEETKKISVEKENSKIPTINNTGMVLSINSKLDTVLKLLNNNWLKNIQEYIKVGNKSIHSKLESIDSKLDVFVSDTTNTDMLNEVSDTINDLDNKITDISPKIESIIPKVEEKLSESDKKLSSMLEELNVKIADIASDENGVTELNNIKDLINEQKNYIEKLEPNKKLEAFSKCLDEMSFEVNAFATDSNADREKLQKTIKEMKESLMSAVITIFDQVSFVEESEDIKDFVEERTDEINQRITEITKQLQQITSPNTNSNYTYTMQDIETDLAKLRLALQQNQQLDLTEISEKLHTITSSVDSLTQDEMKELKIEITNLKEQTELLISTSYKSYDVIHSDLTDKVNKFSSMLEDSAESDRVVRQALVYMGEWIDSASQSINKISSNSEEIRRINEVLDEIGDMKLSINNLVNNIIEEKFEKFNASFSDWNNQLSSLEKQFNKVDSLETQIAQQQERIDRLEMSIGKLVDIVENLDDPALYHKIDKIDKQLSKMGTNIEKLTSYVD